MYPSCILGEHLMNTLIGYSLSFLSTLIVIAGDYYIKIAADRGAAQRG